MRDLDGKEVPTTMFKVVEVPDEETMIIEDVETSEKYHVYQDDFEKKFYT